VSPAPFHLFLYLMANASLQDRQGPRDRIRTSLSLIMLDSQTNSSPSQYDYPTQITESFGELTHQVSTGWTNFAHNNLKVRLPCVPHYPRLT
jgi:hypothetical protein